MNFSFHPDAETEFADGITYYERCELGLGLDFSREVYTAIQNAMDYPSMWPQIDGEVRRCLVHRFPYGVLYSAEPQGIYILAVMHLHREPDCWKDRV